ncbi:MAG TPA: hypothetical protein VLA37_13865, partial [Sphingomonadaceae bacterium]|nr:hypothetical protein [Sphingomonadaceae bacterium]
AQGIILLVNLDRMEDARAIAVKLQEQMPGLTSTKLMDLFFKATALNRQLWVDSLVAAGFPE